MTQPTKIHPQAVIHRMRGYRLVELGRSAWLVDRAGVPVSVTWHANDGEDRQAFLDRIEHQARAVLRCISPAN